MAASTVNHGAWILSALLLASPASGQTPGSVPGSEGGAPPTKEQAGRPAEPAGPGEQEKSGRQFEAKKRERLLQFLQLDGATKAKFQQRLEQLDQKADGLRRQRREAFMALRGQAHDLRKSARRGPKNGGGPGPAETPAAGVVDQGALKAALDRVYAVEESMAGLRRERLQTARELLTPEQQVKFLYFTLKFHKEMRERLQRERVQERERGVEGELSPP